MEYLSANDEQRTQQLIDQKNKSLFIVPGKGTEYHSTKEQCKTLAKKIIKEFDPKDYLAQKIFKYVADGKDHYYAVLYKDFSKGKRDDIANKDEDILYFGRLEIGIPEKTTDEDPRSETFKERIDKTDIVKYPDNRIEYAPVLGEQGYYSYFPATKENSEKLRQTVGVFPKGHQTEFVLSLFNGSRTIQTFDEDEFFDLTIKEAQELDTQKLRQRKATEAKNE